MIGFCVKRNDENMTEGVEEIKHPDKTTKNIFSVGDQVSMKLCPSQCSVVTMVVCELVDDEHVRAAWFNKNHDIKSSVFPEAILCAQT